MQRARARAEKGREIPLRTPAHQVFSTELSLYQGLVTGQEDREISAKTWKAREEAGKGQQQ